MVETSSKIVDYVQARIRNEKNHTLKTNYQGYQLLQLTKTQGILPIKSA